jgi:hypothetical protein
MPSHDTANTKTILLYPSIFFNITPVLNPRDKTSPIVTPPMPASHCCPSIFFNTIHVFKSYSRSVLSMLSYWPVAIRLLGKTAALINLLGMSFDILLGVDGVEHGRSGLWRDCGCLAEVHVLCVSMLPHPVALCFHRRLGHEPRSRLQQEYSPLSYTPWAVV